MPIFQVLAIFFSTLVPLRPFRGFLWLRNKAAEKSQPYRGYVDTPPVKLTLVISHVTMTITRSGNQSNEVRTKSG